MWTGAETGAKDSVKVLRYADGGLQLDRMVRVLGVRTSADGRRKYRDELVAREFKVLGDGKLDPREVYTVVMPDGERVACLRWHDGRGLSELWARKTETLVAKKGLFGKWKKVKGG